MPSSWQKALIFSKEVWQAAELCPAGETEADEDILRRLNDCLVTFQGTHPFHNYTVSSFYAGLRKKWLGYSKRYIEPAAFLLPISIIEDFTKPLNLSFCLFAQDSCTEKYAACLLRQKECLWGRSHKIKLEDKLDLQKCDVEEQGPSTDPKLAATLFAKLGLVACRHLVARIMHKHFLHCHDIQASPTECPSCRKGGDTQKRHLPSQHWREGQTKIGDQRMPTSALLIHRKVLVSRQFPGQKLRQSWKFRWLTLTASFNNSQPVSADNIQTHCVDWRLYKTYFQTTFFGSSTRRLVISMNCLAP